MLIDKKSIIDCIFFVTIDSLLISNYWLSDDNQYQLTN
jgi:hypothetical protein